MKDIKYIWITLMVLVISVWLIAAILHNQEKRISTIENIQIPTISEEEKYFDKLTEDIIQCESQGKMVWGDLDKPHKAFGVAQFQKRIFDWMCKLSGKNLEYTNAEHQRELLRWALENWYGHLWTCYEIVKQK